MLRSYPRTADISKAFEMRPQEALYFNTLRLSPRHAVIFEPNLNVHFGYSLKHTPGTVPDAKGNYRPVRSRYRTQYAHLQELDLSDCHLIGSISDRIGDLVGLTELYLGGNRLDSTCPTSVGKLSQLQQLRVL